MKLNITYAPKEHTPPPPKYQDYKNPIGIWEITTAFRGVNASANRGMEMPVDGIHFTLDSNYAATYGEVVEAKITMGRNLNLMGIESAADFVARFAAVGIAADAIIGEFIDGSATVADIASDWESAGPECLMGEDFTNFLGRHVRHAVDTITFPENGVEEDPAIIVLNIENIAGSVLSPKDEADKAWNDANARAIRIIKRYKEGQGLYQLQKITDTNIIKEFYSNCYPNDDTIFVCCVEGLDEGESESIIKQDIENIGGNLISEDTYKFSNKQPNQIFGKLKEMGFVYRGTIDDDAIDLE